VHDVRVVGDDGVTRTLDGILGMNLLLPSASGVSALASARVHRPPFTQVVVDGPGARLGLTP
jgi:hypothetical protein